MKYTFLAFSLVCCTFSLQSMDVRRELVASELYQGFGLLEDSLTDNINDFLGGLCEEYSLSAEDARRINTCAKGEAQKAFVAFCEEKNTGIVNYILDSYKKNKCGENGQALFAPARKAAFELIEKEVKDKIKWDSQLDQAIVALKE